MCEAYLPSHWSALSDIRPAIIDAAPANFLNWPVSGIVTWRKDRTTANGFQPPCELCKPPRAKDDGRGNEEITLVDSANFIDG